MENDMDPGVLVLSLPLSLSLYLSLSLSISIYIHIYTSVYIYIQQTYRGCRARCYRLGIQGSLLCGLKA